MHESKRRELASLLLKHGISPNQILDAPEIFREDGYLIMLRAGDRAVGQTRVDWPSDEARDAVKEFTRDTYWWDHR